MPSWPLAPNDRLSYGESMKHIRSIDELVEFFGGDTELGKMLGLDQSAIGQWKRRGNISGGWHLRLLAELTGRGATVDPEVFGLSRDEAMPLFERLQKSEGRFLASFA